MEPLFQYVSRHGQLLAAVSAASLLLFVGSMLLVPWLVARAPRDYFVRHAPLHGSGLLVRIAKNLLGVVLFVMGVLMLVLPGQGLLTMFVALALLDVPFKHRLVRRVAAWPSVWRVLSYLRRRAGVPPFEPPRPPEGA